MEMTSETHDAAQGAAPSARLMAAYALVALGPVVAWLAWISWADSTASDSMHVAWFSTVAAGCALAGMLGPPQRHVAPIAVTAFLATMVTLWIWWSSTDITGLFVIGIVMALLPVVAGAFVLVWVGLSLSP